MSRDFRIEPSAGSPKNFFGMFFVLKFGAGAHADFAEDDRKIELFTTFRFIGSKLSNH